MTEIFKYTLVIFGILISSNFCNADPLTISGSVARQLETSLNDQREELATSWDNFIQVRLIKTGSLPMTAHEIKTFNSFALVPGTPPIRDQLGIPLEALGYRLFMTSREETLLRKQSGRCMIFVKLSETPTGRARVLPLFVDEKAAQIILKQFPDFDPTKQPVAFDDLFIYQNRKNIKGDALNELIHRLEKSPPFDPANPHATPPPAISVGEWIAGAVMVALGIFLYVLKKRSKNPSTD